ncbi:MAG: protein-L-isoaspartate O-methyltransferase [Phycisphaerae bacterium]|jgi:protein-L-isoaspartate(D-aspartate) O-methyltransferase|nr:MAG: protein-L-isoaspartate O-methyltransferase [Phycisphaerae bacterium]
MTPLDPVEKLDAMVREQIIARGIKDPRVIEAMKWVPRDRFFPQAIESHAFDDAAAPIGYGQTISQPYIVALMTEALEVQADHRVLEIGTGSGYQTAILSKLTKEVFTIERHKPLLDQAFETLSRLGIRNVRFCFGDGSVGWPAHAPYDRIIITAGTPQVDDRIFAQLAEGGICVAPVGPLDEQSLIQFTKQENRILRKQICGVKFVPLIGEGGWPT